MCLKSYREHYEFTLTKKFHIPLALGAKCYNLLPTPVDSCFSHSGINTTGFARYALSSDAIPTLQDEAMTTAWRGAERQVWDFNRLA